MKEILIKKYMAGTSTHQDEQKLLRLLQEEPQPTAEDQALLSMLSMSVSALQGQEAWLEEDESELFDQLMKEQHEEEAEDAIPQRNTPTLKLPPRRLPRLLVRAMAAAAILSGVFFAVRTLWQDNRQDMTVTYIYGNKVEDREMAMDMMHETMGDLFNRPDVESELADLFN